MVVYADILIILNVLVDYFLVMAASAVLGRKIKMRRQIFAALVGGLSSLYIFAPNLGFFAETVFRIAVCLLMSLCAFGFGGIKSYLRSFFSLLGATLLYGGAMTAIWTFLKPKSMLVLNSVVYFDISPFVLIAVSIVSYFVFLVLSAILSRTSKYAEKCEITVFADEKSIKVFGILDTGNSLKDSFGNAEVIIADKKHVKELLGDTDPLNEKLKLRYRVMPCTTVSGDGALDAFRCDSAILSNGERTVTLEKPILAVSKSPLNDDYQAIVNPKIFM